MLISLQGEERYPHYESIRKFDHPTQEADSHTNDSSSREGSQITESSGASGTSGEKLVNEISTKVVEQLETPFGASTYTPKDVKTIEIFDLSHQVLTRKDIRDLLEDAASRVNITLNELIKRDRERSRSSRSSSNETSSSGKRSRQADDDGDDERPTKKSAKRRSQRLRIKLRVGPDPNASPIQIPQPEPTLKVTDTTPDHRSPLSQSQSTDELSQTQETKSPLTIDTRA